MRCVLLVSAAALILSPLPAARAQCGPQGGPCLIGRSGDFDLDGDVDASDLPLLAACMAGPGVGVGGVCQTRDIDLDGDADLADFFALQSSITGACNCPPNVLPPTARFLVDTYLGVAPLTVTFDAGRTTDAEAVIASYQWSFSDGVLGSGSRFARTFTQPGDYTATLTATDAGGLSGQASLVISVSDGAYNINAPITANEARRFLWQAAFGPDAASVAAVQQLGYEAWIDAQAALPASHILWADQEAHRLAGYGWNGAEEVWDDICVEGLDQLRQRMAWALIQIVVMNTSQVASGSQAEGVYYSTYMDHAFGNYRDLLEYVTFTHHMGAYLTYIENRKADPNIGAVPDENYARELMQLFTIGTWELDENGVRLLGADGKPIPTYGNDEVKQFARVFTGLMWDWQQQDPFLHPMRIETDAHEFGAKQLLTYPGALPLNGFIPAIPPASGTPALVVQDVQLALDNVFHHPNVAPFISRQLIQRFVSSNPTPAYVGRVAAAFEGAGPYGAGVRGDLLATLKAILLDPEARDPAYRSNPQYGKLKEPFVVRWALYRLLERVDRQNEVFPLRLGASHWNALESFGQRFLRSPSVFNFYPPEYVPPGTELARPAMFAPELRIYNDVTAMAALDIIRAEIITPDAPYEAARFAAWKPLASNPATLVDALNQELLYGTMTPEVRTVIINALNQIGSSTHRVRTAVWLITVSPEFRVLR